MITIRFCNVAFLLLVGLNSCIFAVETIISLMPDGSTFPLEGSKAVYKCIAVGSSTPPFAMFEDTSSNNITEGGHISIKRQTFNTTTILTLTFNPIKISDDQTIQCKVKDEGRQVTIHVLPKESLPNVTLIPSGKLSVARGSEVILTCSASTIVQSKITGIHIKWSFLGSKELPDNTNQIKGYGTKNHKFSSLFISGVKEVNAGVYRCSAILTAYGGDQTKPNMYFQDVEVIETFVSPVQCYSCSHQHPYCIKPNSSTNIETCHSSDQVCVTTAEYGWSKRSGQFEKGFLALERKCVVPGPDFNNSQTENKRCNRGDVNMQCYEYCRTSRCNIGIPDFNFSEFDSSSSMLRFSGTSFVFFLFLAYF